MMHQSHLLNHVNLNTDAHFHHVCTGICMNTCEVGVMNNLYEKRFTIVRYHKRI
jgi:hypothetical protein